MLTETRRHQIVDLLHALIRKDERALLDVLMDWGGVPRSTRSAWRTKSPN
jgi:predicted unusual protein kinase regulating ubiquinone biosynthesis (AarF/ABC1/UbiB family)